MQQVFPLEVNLGATRVSGQACNMRQRSGPTGVIAQQGTELRLKRRTFAGTQVRRGQLFERSHQSLGYEATAIGSPVTVLVRLCCKICHTTFTTAPPSCNSVYLALLKLR